MRTKRKIFFSLLIIIITIFSTILFGGHKTRTQYDNKKVGFDYPPMIFWKDTLYVIKKEVYLSELKNQIDTKVGEITKFIDGTEKPKTNGTSNIFKKGCSIYTLKDEKESKKIVIKYDKKYHIFQSSGTN